jgi:hypothetical protein
MSSLSYHLRFSLVFRGCTTRTGYFKCREVKTGFYQNKSMQTGSSGTLIGWKSGQTTFVPLWDRMEGAWLRTLVKYTYTEWLKSQPQFFCLPPFFCVCHLVCHGERPGKHTEHTENMSYVVWKIKGNNEDICFLFCMLFNYAACYLYDGLIVPSELWPVCTAQCVHPCCTHYCTYVHVCIALNFHYFHYITRFTTMYSTSFKLQENTEHTFINVRYD